METNQLLLSSVPNHNKAEFNGSSYLPDEIWLNIGRMLPFNDAKSFRLVNRTLRRHFTYILRKTHRPISFRSTQKLYEFQALLLPNSGELPFSILQFDLPSLGPGENVGILTQIANMIGGNIRELRFLEPLDFEESTPWDEFHSGYSQCLSVFLARVPHLSSLKMNVYDYRLPLASELLLPEVFPHLKKLKFRLMFTCGSLIGVETMRKLIQRSPSLEELSIHAGPRFVPRNLGTETKMLLLGLPAWLDCLPRRCRVKLRLWNVTDQVKVAMEKLRDCQYIQLSALRVDGLVFKDSETYGLFWGWMASQPLRELCLKNSIPVPFLQSNPPSFLFTTCTNLTLWNWSNRPSLHFQFPNLCHLQLGLIDSNSLHEIKLSFPQLQRLSGELTSGKGWDTLVGRESTKVLELLVGVRPRPAEELFDCPIQGFKSLRILELTLSTTLDLLAIVFVSSGEIIQKLESLILTVAPTISASDKQRYQDALSAHHTHVILRPKSVKESWWLSHGT